MAESTVGRLLAHTERHADAQPGVTGLSRRPDGVMQLSIGAFDTFLRCDDTAKMHSVACRHRRGIEVGECSFHVIVRGQARSPQFGDSR